MISPHQDFSFRYKNRNDVNNDLDHNVDQGGFIKFDENAKKVDLPGTPHPHRQPDPNPDHWEFPNCPVPDQPGKTYPDIHPVEVPEQPEEV